MTAATTTARSTSGTLARSVLAVALPIAVGTWIHVVTSGQPSATVLAVLVLLAVVGTLHVALTSPTAAWLVDSRTVLPDLLPVGTARIAVAWTAPLLWAAAFVAMAVAHHRVASPVKSVALLGVGATPLLFGNALPTDAYRLLWDTTALGHPLYAAGACTVLLMVLNHDRASQRPAPPGALQGRVYRPLVSATRRRGGSADTDGPLGAS